jgi:flagellar biogenesis protein FliO
MGLGLALAAAAPAPARAEDPPALSVGAPSAHPIGRRAPSGEPGGAGPSGGWWLGTLGVVAALGAFAALSLAGRRGRLAGDSAALKVVGRVALGPRQSAVLLRAGDRVLILGVGPQGAPSLLGELPADSAAATEAGPGPVRVVVPAAREGGAR